MKYLDGKPFIVTDGDISTFKRIKKPYHCKLCGHKFAAGDTARWIYANGTPGACTGNFFVCKDCDGETSDVIKRGAESLAMAVKLAKQWDIYGPDWQRDCL